MKRVTFSCCSPKVQELPGAETMEIPEAIRQELEEMGGLEALAEQIPPKNEIEAQSSVYHALADPLRLTILYLIKDQPLCVCVINRFMRLSGSKLSYHLAILKEAGLIEGEYHGNWIIYTLTDTGRRHLE